MYARGGAAEAVSDGAWLQAMLDVEAALARACAREGLIPEDAAEAIAAACRAELFSVEELAASVADTATPVVGLVRALRSVVRPDSFAEFVHHGATSQDVLDTAMMLVARRALDPLLLDARSAAGAAAALADAHRATPMAGRTLLQQALPISFGLKAAGWLSGVDEGVAGLVAVRDRSLAVQMGGAVGSRAPAVAGHVAALLGLAEPVLPWHAVRVRPVALASALGALAGVLAKVAGDVVLLSQNEVAEVREGGGPDRGGSSAMAHKRNPVAAVSVIACAERVPGLVATMLTVMAQEHERGGGRWQAEWGTVSDLLALTGSAAAWAAELLGGLEVDADRMRANLGRLAEAGVSEAADPEAHLDGAEELIDRALTAHRGGLA